MSAPPKSEDEDGEPIADKIERLTKELFAHFDESARLEQIVRDSTGAPRCLSGGAYNVRGASRADSRWKYVKLEDA